ncbi:MAG: PAS domain-containing protein [Bdellovibrio sp.]|nr:PAS domain-containing protein [Bdellovibrio sp.]
MEAHFSLNELFFSKTDFKGLILTGNSVFVRVSEYSKAELLRKPHNIIRHSDVPRSVFKLFWTYLHSQKPIAAYVKNRSKSGKFYWVFAMTFPMADGYLSVRLKPTSRFFVVIQQVYAEVLEKEKNDQSMDEGIAYILEKLTGLGFNSYDEFMTAALIEELQVRDEALQVERAASSSEKVLGGRLGDLVIASENCTVAARAAFSTSGYLSKITQDLMRATQEVLAISDNVKLVTTNLTIASSKLGEAGKPLAMVSTNLERLCLEIIESSNRFRSVFDSFQKSVMRIYLAVATSRFQIEVLNQFIGEIINGEKSESEEDEARSLFANCFELKQLIAENFKNVESIAQDLSRDNKSLLQSLTALSKVTAGMDVICVVGKIEMARIQDLSSSLAARLKDMEDLTLDFKKSLRQIESESKTSLGHSVALNDSFGKISSSLKWVEELVLA